MSYSTKRYKHSVVNDDNQDYHEEVKRLSKSPSRFSKLTKGLLINIEDFLSLDELNKLSRTGGPTTPYVRSYLQDYKQCHQLTERGKLCRSETFEHKKKCRRYCEDLSDFYLDNIDNINFLLDVPIKSEVEILECKAHRETRLADKWIEFVYKIVNNNKNGNVVDDAKNLSSSSSSSSTSTSASSRNNNTIITVTIYPEYGLYWLSPRLFIRIEDEKYQNIYPPTFYFDITGHDLSTLINHYFKLEPDKTIIKLKLNHKLDNCQNDTPVKVNFKGMSSDWDLYNNSLKKTIIDDDKQELKQTSINDKYINYALITRPIAIFVSGVKWNFKSPEEKEILTNVLQIPATFKQFFIKALDQQSKISLFNDGMINQEYSQWKNLIQQLPPNFDELMKYAIRNYSTNLKKNRL